jgi:hypothetical protein
MNAMMAARLAPLLPPPPGRYFGCALKGQITGEAVGRSPFDPLLFGAERIGSLADGGRTVKKI